MRILVCLKNEYKIWETLLDQEMLEIVWSLGMIKPNFINSPCFRKETWFDKIKVKLFGYDASLVCNDEFYLVVKTAKGNLLSPKYTKAKMLKYNTIH